MADIELVIKIPEDTYKRTKFYKEFRDLNDCVLVLKAIDHAIEFPKGHGRLIDADMLDDVIMQMNENGAEITRHEYKVIDSVLFEMPTIIEADKESEEE